MRPISWCLPVLMFLGLWAAEPGTPMETGRMGYLTPGMNMTDLKEVRIAFRLWIREMGKESDLDVEVEYRDDAETYMEEYRNGRFNMLAANPYHLLRHRDTLLENSLKMWGVRRGGELFDSMLILVRRDSAVTALADLKGRKVMIHNEDLLGRMFLEKELLETVRMPMARFLRVESGIDRHSTAVLKTFFGSADACVVPRHVFETMSEVNPGLRRELVALRASPPIFFTFVLMAHREISPTQLGAFERHIATLQVTPRGQNIMALFRMEGIEPFTAEQLKPLYDYYRAYETLKARYGEGAGS